MSRIYWVTNDGRMLDADVLPTTPSIDIGGSCPRHPSMMVTMIDYAAGVYQCGVNTAPLKRHLLPARFLQVDGDHVIVCGRDGSASERIAGRPAQEAHP